MKSVHIPVPFNFYSDLYFLSPSHAQMRPLIVNHSMIQCKTFVYKLSFAFAEPYWIINVRPYWATAYTAGFSSYLHNIIPLFLHSLFVRYFFSFFFAFLLSFWKAACVQRRKCSLRCLDKPMLYWLECHSGKKVKPCVRQMRIAKVDSQGWDLLVNLVIVWGWRLGYYY